jgi:hypothetical protein
LLPNYSWNQFISAEKKVQQHNFLSTDLRLKYSHILKKITGAKSHFTSFLVKFAGKK